MKRKVIASVLFLVIIIYFLFFFDLSSSSVERLSDFLGLSRSSETVKASAQPGSQNTNPETIRVHLITEEELNAIVKRSKIIGLLPSDANIALSFFDKYGRDIIGYGFTIDGSGNVKKGFSDYEVRISIGEYRIPKLKSTDEICDAFNEFYELQDIRIELGSIGKIKALMKYNSMRNCVGFSI